MDISDEAVRFARELSDASGIAATFERADVYDWLDAAGREGRSFDVVFASYGAIGWLSDLRAWARGIAGVLRPGGRFVASTWMPPGRASAFVQRRAGLHPREEEDLKHALSAAGLTGFARLRLPPLLVVKALR